MLKKLFDRFGRHDERGREVLDPTPMAVPTHLRRPPTLQEQIRMMVRSEELRRAVSDAGGETFEEADDFDVGDDFDPTSPYEEAFDPPVEEDRAYLTKSLGMKEDTPPSQPKKKGKFQEEKPIKPESPEEDDL